MTVGRGLVVSGGAFPECLDRTGLESEARLEGKAAGALRGALARCCSQGCGQGACQGLWP